MEIHITNSEQSVTAVKTPERVINKISIVVPRKYDIAALMFELINA